MHDSVRFDSLTSLYYENLTMNERTARIAYSASIYYVCYTISNGHVISMFLPFSLAAVELCEEKKKQWATAFVSCFVAIFISLC